MMWQMKPYSETVDSGVEWLGEVPEHWEVRRARYVFGEVDRRSRDGLEQHLSMSQRLGLVPSHLVENRTLVSENYAGAKLCKVGDLVLNRLKAHLGVFALAHYDGIVSPDYTVLRIKTSGRAEFFEQALRSSRCRTELRIRAKGVVEGFWRLYTDDFNEIRIPVPPDAEQAAIVRFLDHADRHIRRYIRAKERLIELLEEEKQVIIREAVTGQIDVRTGQPYPAYKDSGVEWLGEVPEHWDVRRLKTLSVMQSGDAITAMSIDETGDYPVYGGNGLRGYTSSYTHDGDFVLIGRQGALCGNIHLAHGRFWASEHAVVATLRRGHILDWFGALLGVMDLNQYSIAAAQPGLSVDRVMNLWAPVPPIREQMRISERLVERSSHLLEAVEATKRQIALLREYHTRLIADVVTGKLDVRDAAAELPSQGDLVADCDGIAAEYSADVTSADVEPA